MGGADTCELVGIVPHRGGPVYGRFCRVHLQRPVGRGGPAPSCPDRGALVRRPLLGWLLGSRFQALITSVDHWIAFVLLCAIGGNMVRESRTCGACREMDASFAPKVMLPLAVATSIDALAIGVTFAFLQVDILSAVCFIGAVTFVFSSASVKVGSVFGTRYQSKAELFGGVVLIGMGIKILLEHLGVLG